MTATITKPKSKKAATKPQSPYKRLHVIIPITDMLWASQQKPSVRHHRAKTGKLYAKAETIIT